MGMKNGQMFQIASIVAASKKALQLSEPIRFSPLEYENKIEFVFLPQKKFLKTKKYIASNVSLWFEQIKKNGIQDIKLLCPYSVKDRQFLGFSNTTESCILCFFKSGRITYFTADWQFDSVLKKWNILYSEHEWINPPSKKPSFENNINSFRDVLLSIKELAEKIECENFATIFTSAINLLDGCNEYPDENMVIAYHQYHNKIFKCSKLQVFRMFLEQWVRGMIAQHIWLPKKGYPKNTKHCLLSY